MSTLEYDGTAGAFPGLDRQNGTTKRKEVDGKEEVMRAGGGFPTSWLSDGSPGAMAANSNGSQDTWRLRSEPRVLFRRGHRVRENYVFAVIAVRDVAPMLRPIRRIYGRSSANLSRGGVWRRESG